MMSFSTAEILRIAKLQKIIILLLVVNLLTFWIPGFWLLLAIPGVVFVYKLAKAVRASVPLVWSALLFVPLGCILSLAVLSSRATKVIKSAGVRVGLLGAKTADLKALESNVSPLP